MEAIKFRNICSGQKNYNCSCSPDYHLCNDCIIFIKSKAQSCNDVNKYLFFKYKSMTTCWLCQGNKKLNDSDLCDECVRKNNTYCTICEELESSGVANMCAKCFKNKICPECRMRYSFVDEYQHYVCQYETVCKLTS